MFLGSSACLSSARSYQNRSFAVCAESFRAMARAGPNVNSFVGHCCNAAFFARLEFSLYG
jgi:hypothetical protein